MTATFASSDSAATLDNLAEPATARSTGVVRKAAVRCAGVTKTFGAGSTQTQALRGVDLAVYPGELTLLVGPSGCGKTTLISIIAGLLDPSSGSVELFDSDLGDLSAGGLVRFRAAHIGFVFQQLNLLPSLTAAENTAVPLLVRNVPRRIAVARAKELLAEVGLAERANALPNELSGGQQQRVAIARALLNEPRLLVCDEPTAALDAQSGQTVMRLFRQVAVRDDRVVIVVTHDNRVFSYGERIVHMSDGCIVRVEDRGVAAAADEGARSKLAQTPSFSFSNV